MARRVEGLWTGPKKSGRCRPVNLLEGNSWEKAGCEELQEGSRHNQQHHQYHHMLLNDMAGPAKKTDEDVRIRWKNQRENQ